MFQIVEYLLRVLVKSKRGTNKSSTIFVKMGSQAVEDTDKMWCTLKGGDYSLLRIATGFSSLMNCCAVVGEKIMGCSFCASGKQRRAACPNSNGRLSGR